MSILRVSLRCLSTLRTWRRFLLIIRRASNFPTGIVVLYLKSNSESYSRLYCEEREGFRCLLQNIETETRHSGYLHNLISGYLELRFSFTITITVSSILCGEYQYCSVGSLLYEYSTAGDTYSTYSVVCIGVCSLLWTISFHL